VAPSSTGEHHSRCHHSCRCCQALCPGKLRAMGISPCSAHCRCGEKKCCSPGPAPHAAAAQRSNSVFKMPSLHGYKLVRALHLLYFAQCEAHTGLCKANNAQLWEGGLGWLFSYRAVPRLLLSWQAASLRFAVCRLYEVNGRTASTENMSRELAEHGN
jgi:hypothetical protein